MEETELILHLVKYFDPEVYDNPAFMQYLKERIDSYYDYSFFREMEETLKWKVDDSLQKARNPGAYLPL